MIFFVVVISQSTMWILTKYQKKQAWAQPYHSGAPIYVDDIMFPNEREARTNPKNFKYPKSCRRIWNADEKRWEWRQYDYSDTSKGARLTCPELKELK
tara:strand:+ start:1116 stop:1409 length:294 start_codon:yes stop_codon:yes gene_type:complete